jgi:hypothetical protein
MPKAIETNQNNRVIALCNKEIKLGRTIPCNKPDTMLLEKNGACLLIDASVPSGKI